MIDDWSKTFANRNGFTEITLKIWLSCRKQTCTEANKCAKCVFDTVKCIEIKQSANEGFKSYRIRVRELTEKVSHLIPGIERRGFYDHHIDHIKSIWFGYKNGISEAEIADLSNLRMLSCADNLKKGRSCVV